MSTFAFAVLPAMGHLNPMLSIAEQLENEGHRIIFICFAPEAIADHVEAYGFRLEGIPGIDPSYFKLGELLMMIPTGFFETVNGVKIMFGRLPLIARKTHNVLEKICPDMVVADFTFPAACLAAEMIEIPSAVVYHAGLCFKGPGIPPFGSGLPIGGTWGRRGRLCKRLFGLLERNIETKIARARRLLGLPQSQLQVFSLSRYLTLVLTSERIEAPRYPLSSTTYFIGPCLTARKRILKDEGFPFDKLSRDKPKIYVTLGTFFNNRPKLFCRIINGLTDDHYQIIVKAGSAFRALLSMQAQGFFPNVLIFENIPQMEILHRVDLVICHGGNNTVNESLAAGKPLLVIPIGGEQGDNAAKVVWLGAGLRADVKRSTASEIREKVERLLEEKCFRERAEELAGEIERTNGAVTAARFITHVAETGEPLTRPEDYPQTVTREMGVPWE